MEAPLRKLSVGLVYLFFILFSSLVGLLFDLHFGFAIGIIFSLIVITTIAIYGEKIVLLLAKARYITDDEKLINQLKNFCTHLSVPEVKIYWSNTYYNNVYFVNSYFGVPSIIIGREAYRQLSKNEMNSLIYATLLRIKSNESKHRTTINLLMLMIFSWVFFIGSLLPNKLKPAMSVFLFPAFYLKSKFYKARNDIDFFDSEIFKLDLLKRDYISALFKVNNLTECRSTSLGSLALSGLTHTYNKIDDSIFYLLMENEISIEERIKKIAGNLK